MSKQVQTARLHCPNNQTARCIEMAEAAGYRVRNPKTTGRTLNLIRQKGTSRAALLRSLKAEFSGRFWILDWRQL